MKIVLAALGAENISLEYLSATLKKGNHRVSLAYDEALFDDQMYITMPRLGRIFSRTDRLIEQIVQEKPDLLGITVMASTYQWALRVARGVKKSLDVPVIFGGIHPTSLPERVIRQPEVDMVCIGEGDRAFLELADSMERGDVDTTIKNIWFKRNGNIIRNSLRPLIEDLDSLPFPDKELFENSVPINYCYLTVTSRGCPYQCSYCSLALTARQNKEIKGKIYRERSVENVIEELRLMKQRYNYDWVDIKNNIFSPSKKWALEFARRYKEEINLPLRVFGHPHHMDDEKAAALKEAGCWRVQMGIESFSEELRRNILFRNESNEDIRRACRAMDKVDLKYSLDFILGLPGQDEDGLKESIRFIAGCRSCIRVTPFWIAYLPQTPLVDIALKLGNIGPEDVERLENGLDKHYLSTGSIHEAGEIKRLLGYHMLFRMAPTVPAAFTSFILKRNLQKILRYLPTNAMIAIMDFLVTFKVKDLTAIAYIKIYIWTILKRVRSKLRPA
ncbi:MAG: radical SAM protein [bacterium]